MLINWGLMTGRYEDGVIKTTKFGLLKMVLLFTLYSYEGIKWNILMFYPEESQVACYFGEFLQYFGPKMVVDFILIAESVNSISLILLFYFLSNRMLFWLDHMQFDNESRCFDKLNLNVSDSKRFTKQFALLLSIANKANYFLTSIAFIVPFASFLIFKHECYFNYIISISGFGIGIWYLVQHWFSLNLVLYQVN